MMSTITVELPETLTRQIEAQRVPREELKAVVVAMMEVWLAQREQRKSNNGGDGRPGLFRESAVPFARRLIAQNRALFEELARR